MNNDDLHEIKRMDAVKSYEILDTNPESDFDDLVKLASKIFQVPIATITIVDSHRQWFKASVGLPMRQTARDISFCSSAIELTDPLIVEDTSQDHRFSQNPLVLNDPHLKFYAGAPLLTADNLAIGTFCIMDHTNRVFSNQELDTLKTLANQAMKLIELRAGHSKLHALTEEVERINHVLLQDEQRWKFSLESAGEGVWEWNVKTNEVIFTKRWLEMLGYDENELSHHYETWVSIVHHDDLAKVVQHLNDYLSHKTDIYAVSYRLLCKDNSWKWVLTRGMVVECDQDGSALRMIGTHADISKEKEKEYLSWKHAKIEALIGLI